jgi:hypothetical protein
MTEVPSGVSRNDAAGKVENFHPDRSLTTEPPCR